MCTLTWYTHAHGYELFFNRDESIERLRANPPALGSFEGCRYIAPIDADAGGTWISVNEHGLTVCILNHYQFEQLKTYKTWVSRGVLVQKMADLQSLDQASRRFNALNLTDFRAFRLFVITPEGENRMFVWDGHSPRTEYNVLQPKSSSAVDSMHVKDKRRQLYKELISPNNKTVDAHLTFHASHHPKASSESVCMHRPEANTVSMSHISVDRDVIRFAYADGAPCTAQLGSPIELDRSPLTLAAVSG